MIGRNSAVSLASPPKPPSRSRRNAPHPTTRKRPRETLRPFARRTQAFGVSGCRRCVRRRANARKYRDNSGDHRNRKYAAVSGGFVAGGPGFEPRLTESEFAVLPLNYPPQRPQRDACKAHLATLIRKGRRSEGRAGIGFGSGFTSLCGVYDPDPPFPWSAGSRKEGRSPEMNPRVCDRAVSPALYAILFSFSRLFLWSSIYWSRPCLSPTGI